MTAKPNVHPFIPKTCRALDAFFDTPDWDRLVNIKTLQMSSSTYCIVGQTGRKLRRRRYLAPDKPLLWNTYEDGRMILDDWARENPEALRKLGIIWSQVQAALQYRLPDRDGVGQTEQWRMYLAWRHRERGVGDRLLPKVVEV